MATAMAPAVTAVPRGSALGLLSSARSVLADAGATGDAGERFRLAHLSALRTAAAVSAQRGRPTATRKRLLSVWVLLDRVAPEFGDWATFFAAGAATRAAVEAGATSAVTLRAADDEVRAATEFLALVEDSMGLLAA